MSVHPLVAAPRVTPIVWPGAATQQGLWSRLLATEPVGARS
jgi:hypothetical protein